MVVIDLIHSFLYTDFTSAFSSLPYLPGGHSAVVPPVPIPNTEVKCSHADGSATYVCVRVGHCQASLPKNPYQFSGTGFCFHEDYFLKSQVYLFFSDLLTCIMNFVSVLLYKLLVIVL